MSWKIDRVMQEIYTLSVEDRLHLVGRIVDSMLSGPKRKSHRPLKYGEFQGPNPSTEEDFKIAEWHLEDQDFNGE